MKQKFRDARLSKDNWEKLYLINQIVDDYKSQGYKLTLRQLYYQLVTQNIITNKDTEYKKIGKILTEGRMAGIVDWDIIEDRVRKPTKPYYCLDIADALKDTLKSYRRDRMEAQNNYIEVWVEKDALSGVLKRVTEKYGINILVNKGYSSVTAMFDSYNRFQRNILEGKICHILYLGDHDPSGQDMIRDIWQRLSEFLYSDEEIWEYYKQRIGENGSFTSGQRNKYWDYIFNTYYQEPKCETYSDEVGKVYFDGVKGFILDNLRIEPIALTTDQIRQYEPPPNPAKITDPRAKDYISLHGNYSWEVDALKPQILHKILEDSILEVIDLDKYKESLLLEAKEIIELKKLVDTYES